MTISLPWEKMTIEEKLQVMKAIWDDLSRHANQMPPPAWHKRVLKALEEAKPGDRILMCGFGQGANALYFEVTDNIANLTDRNGVAGSLVN
ncbi:MAG: addiction module protein, partial [Pseudomonadota bacterium]